VNTRLEEKFAAEQLRLHPAQFVDHSAQHLCFFISKIEPMLRSIELHQDRGS